MRWVPAVPCVLVVAACGDASPPSAPAPIPPVAVPAEAPASPRPRVTAPAAPRVDDLDALIDAYLAADGSEPCDWRGPGPETVRCADAIRALGAPAIERLSSQLRGADPDAASRAGDILRLFGAEAVPPMLAVISDPSLRGEEGEATRYRALSVLQATSKTWCDGPLAAEVAAALMKLVRATDDPSARIPLIETLWSVGAAGAPYAEEWGRLAADVPSDDRDDVAFFWLHLIRGLGPRGAPAARSVIAVLDGADDDAAIDALIEMGSVPDPEMDALRAILRGRDPGRVKSVCAVFAAWGSAGDAARPELLQLLQDPEFADLAASAFTVVPDPDTACISAMLRAAGAGSTSAQERIEDWARVPDLASKVEAALAGADLAPMQAGVAALVEHAGRDGKALVARLLRVRDAEFSSRAIEPLTQVADRATAARPVVDTVEPLESDVVDGDFAWLVFCRGRDWRGEGDLRRLARDIEEGPPLAAAVRDAVAGRVDPRDAVTTLRGAARLSLVLPPEERSLVRAQLAAHSDESVRREVARAIAADASAEMGAVPLAAGDMRVLVGLLRDAASDCRSAAAMALAAHGTAAVAAIPDLDRIASEDAMWDVRVAAVVALLRAHAAPDVVRPHVGAILRHDWSGDQGDPDWDALAAVLSEAPSAAVPLTDALHAVYGDDPNAVRTAIGALRPHGPAAAQAVPCLIELVQLLDYEARDTMPRFGVVGFGHARRGRWVELWQDDGPAVARTLAAIGADAAPALPALRSLALHSDDRAPILAAIRTIEAAR